MVLGELLAGAYHGGRKEKMLQQIDAFLRSAALLVPDETTAYHYGMIYSELYQDNPADECLDFIKGEIRELITDF